jgi:hypothetical protein
MLETIKIKLGDKYVYQLKNKYEINELLTLLNKKFLFNIIEKTTNDILFEQMIKRKTYIVPIYHNSKPILIYFTEYQNMPCIFVINLLQYRTIYVIPMRINNKYNDVLIYGELVIENITRIYLEKFIYYNGRKVDNIEYNSHIELFNELNKLWEDDWISPKPIYMINELEKMNEGTISGVRFYTFINPVVFYKNPINLKNRLIFNMPFKLNQVKIQCEDIRKENINIDDNKEYELYINSDNNIYGIYNVYDKEKREIGVIRFKTFEEFNELREYIRVGNYKTLLLLLKYNKKFEKWMLVNKELKENIIMAN